MKEIAVTWKRSFANLHDFFSAQDSIRLPKQIGVEVFIRASVYFISREKLDDLEDGEFDESLSDYSGEDPVRTAWEPFTLIGKLRRKKNSREMFWIKDRRGKLRVVSRLKWARSRSKKKVSRRVRYSAPVTSTQRSAIRRAAIVQARTLLKNLGFGSDRLRGIKLKIEVANYSPED